MTRIQKNRARHMAIIAANWILFLMYSPMLLLGLSLRVVSIITHLLFLVTFLEWGEVKTVVVSVWPLKAIKNYSK